MYTEDAYVLPPGADIVKGRAAIEAFWKQAVQQFGDAKLTTIDVLPLSRSAAREIGRHVEHKGAAVSANHRKICRPLAQSRPQLEARHRYLEYE